MRMNVKRTIIAAASAAAILIGLAAPQSLAQQVPGRTGATAQPSAPAMVQPTMAQPTVAAATPPKAEWVVTPKEDTVRVPLHKVVSVRLPGPAKNVVIANPDIADVILPEGTSNHVFVLARQVGSTSIVFEDGRGGILFQGDIQVDVDVAGIQAAMKEMLPEEKIDVVSHRNSVFLKGFVRSAVASNTAINVARKFVADPIEVINSLEVLGSQQVIMKVQIAEIKRNAVKNLGLDTTVDMASNNGWGLSFATSKTAFTSFATGTATTGWGSLGPMTIDILEKETLAKTLAEPTLTAVSGETASFLVGGSFPMPTSYDANTGTITFEQTQFGVALNFTPIVLDKGRISLRVQTTVSDRDDNVEVTTTFGTIPGLSEKTTETTVEVPSGGTLFISGLLQNDVIKSVEGVPGLKDIPILGTLFRSEAFQNEETELVVAMTAYLAEPTSNSEPLAMPTDGFVPAGDLDFYLLGRLHKLYTNKELSPYATPLTGPYGYIME